MNHLRHQKYKNNRQINNRLVLKVQNCPLELQKWLKLIILSINDMDRFEKKNYQRIEYLQKTLGTIGMIG